MNLRYPPAAWPRGWEAGEVVHTADFKTDGKGKAGVTAKLPAGAYRAVVETTDRFGRRVVARTEVLVLDPAADHLAVKTPVVFAAPAWTVEPGKEFVFYWGTGYAQAGRFWKSSTAGRSSGHSGPSPGRRRLC